jgi:hypothetical protein
MSIYLIILVFAAALIAGLILPGYRRRECWRSAKNVAAVLAVPVGLSSQVASAEVIPVISAEDRTFLEDLERRAVLYFWEQSDPSTGLVRDRANADGGPAKDPSRDIASLAATGFGLTALCIGTEHGWIPREQAEERVRNTLKFFAAKAFEEHGWFYHWMDVGNGDRKWDSEVSSVDTSYLLGGVLTAAQYFSDDPEIPKLAKEIYERVDFEWMLDGDRYLLSHGWLRGKGFLKLKWDTYSEQSLLYLLAIGSPTHPIPADSWYAWQRPVYTYGPYTFVSGGPLFTHQYAHAWVDFRNRRDRGFIDFFKNSESATRANQLYSSKLPAVLAGDPRPDIWGITASDGPNGYRIYAEFQYFDAVDGTVAPSAAGGSLMFTPDISIPTLRAMRERFGDRVYRKYGFVDAYNLALKWFDTDVVGIDLGVILLSAENLVTGNVWRWFMAKEVVPRAMDLAGFSHSRSETPEPAKKNKQSRK